MKLLALGGLFLSTASAFLIPTTPQVPGARTATNTGRIATLTPAGPSTLPQTAMASTAAPAATTSFVGSTLVSAWRLVVGCRPTDRMLHDRLSAPCVLTDKRPPIL